MSSQKKEGGLIDKLCANASKIIKEHDLDVDKDKFLYLSQVTFPHGRADIVIYGLYKGLYVVPLGVEVKKQVSSGTELFHYINQIRETYEHAFTYIYLAIDRIKNNVRKLVEYYLSDIGYGFIKVSEGDVDVVVKASPKKAYRSEHDHNVVASRGMLYISARQALMDEGFVEENIRKSSVWIGLDLPINYCAFLYGNYAIFGVYARSLKRVEQLLEFLESREDLLQSLRERGYRIYLESYLAVRGVRGVVHHLDEPISADVVKRLYSMVKRGIKPMPIPRWGAGLGIYKRLWNIESVPTYATALRSIKDELDQLRIFREEGIISVKATSS